MSYLSKMSVALICYLRSFQRYLIITTNLRMLPEISLILKQYLIDFSKNLSTICSQKLKMPFSQKGTEQLDGSRLSA